MFTPTQHPIATAVAASAAELDGLADVALFGLTDEELAELRAAVAVEKNKWAELELRLIGDSITRGSDTKTDLVRQSHETPAVARRRVRLAAALAEHPLTQQAMTTGGVTEAQAEVIVHAVTALPADHPAIDADVRREAEKTLVALAAEHHPGELRVLGRRILDVVAPEVADAIAGTALQAEHDQALLSCRLTLTDDGQGRCHLRGHIPTSVGIMLKRHLLALQAPKHVRTGPDGELILKRPSPERLAQALCEYIERYPLDRLPMAGGVQARSVVTLDHEQLLQTVGASTIATVDGTPIPAGEARRLACEAGIIPVVLSGESKPLDVGRSKRFHTPAQRLALELRDKTCTTEGCDWPAYLSHAHHETPWSKGGHTNLEAARLLCPHHHQFAHHPTWQMRKTKHGQVTFLRR